jgi:hypothetical protein
VGRRDKRVRREKDGRGRRGRKIGVERFEGGRARRVE